MAKKKEGFGTGPVYLTAISTILGAILFLRFGYAVGTLGLWGVLLLILLGHLITIPTALAVSELATNTRVAGGGEYYVISRSFGLKIGATIGIALYFAQAISIAFYTIAFTEAFAPLFEWARGFWPEIPKQLVSVPLLVVLWLVVRGGVAKGVNMLYAVNVILALSLLLFLWGTTAHGVQDAAAAWEAAAVVDNLGFFHPEQFFVVFAICFPAFTGITAGVGLSGELRDPGRSIPKGTLWGVVTGLLVYVVVVIKLAISAPQTLLLDDELVMAQIALFGAVVIPLGLAACTSSSALSSFMVAPRTLQALASDGSFPWSRLNAWLAAGAGKKKEPRNAILLSFVIALLFVLLGSIDKVAGVITLFFLITYGTLCLISFLNHFGSSPSYRPRFRSRWYVSLGGFVLSVWVMFMINALLTVVSYIFIVLIYIFLERSGKKGKGLADIFEGALYQANRALRIFIQTHRTHGEGKEWRPSVICISPNSFEREKPLELMRWMCHRHGFGTYFHYIENYFSRQTYTEARAILRQLIDLQRGRSGMGLYIDTMISPSYTSAIAQVIQTPSVSGMENNMAVFEYDMNHPGELARILENIHLVRAGELDVCLFAGSPHMIRTRNGLHIWIRRTDEVNTNLMILLGYIIISHPDWRDAEFRIFITSTHEAGSVKNEIEKRISEGRIPVTLSHIEIVTLAEGEHPAEPVRKYSRNAGLCIIGFREEILRHEPERFFSAFRDMGDILFVNAGTPKTII
ncbi:MAG: amino acid permease [Tannerellaceae bacterium]|jgi:amino acid transporter|nr:amino acid permease [Tannerellaceae bacterium]